MVHMHLGKPADFFVMEKYSHYYAYVRLLFVNQQGPQSLKV